MCHAILRVKYLSDKQAQLIEVSSEAEKLTKISELREKDQVIAIAVFPRTQDLVLSKRWETREYVPAAVVVADEPTTRGSK